MRLILVLKIQRRISREGSLSYAFTRDSSPYPRSPNLCPCISSGTVCMTMTRLGCHGLFSPRLLTLCYYSTDISIRLKTKCSIQLGFASLNRTFNLSPDENICTIALITIHYVVLYNISLDYCHLIG